jgi:hypothetical protein
MFKRRLQAMGWRIPILSRFAVGSSMHRLKAASVCNYLQALYLVRLIQNSSSDTAEAVMGRDVASWRPRRAPVQREDWEELLRCAVQAPANAPATSPGLPARLQRLHELPELVRSAAALFYAELLPLEVIARVCRVSAVDLATLLAAARRGLGHPQVETGGTTPGLLPLWRPCYREEIGLASLEQLAHPTPITVEHLEAQQRFDDGVSQELGAFKISGQRLAVYASALELDNRLEAQRPGERVDGTAAGHPTQPASRSPAADVAGVDPPTEDEEDETAEPPTRTARPLTILLAIGVGLIGTVVIAWFVISERMNSFAGAERVSALLDSADAMNGDEFEPVNTSARDLEDYFFLKHGLEHYAVPRELGELRTLGYRVVKFNGTDVAEIMVTGPKEALLFVFPAHDFGVRLPSGKWEIIQSERWVGGLRGDEEVCCLVAFRGTRGEMQAFLQSHFK